MPKKSKQIDPGIGWEEVVSAFQPYNTDPPTISLLGNHQFLAFNWDAIEEVLKFVPRRSILGEVLGDPPNPLERLGLALLLAHAEYKGWKNPYRSD